MSSRCRNLILAVLLLAASKAAAGEPLRVCLDPNSLPFSNQRGEGFENRIARMLADHLGRELEEVWWAQRRGFVREAVNAGLCDVVPGVPAGFERLATTSPYYRSTYVVVTRSADHLSDLRRLDDPRLRQLRLGVQMIGDDFSNTPPAHALAGRGIVQNIRGYSVLGDYSEEMPAANIVRALARSDIDVAFVWGPLAGFAAGREAVPLTLAPVSGTGPDDLRMTYSIAVGVRRGDTELQEALDKALADMRPHIDALLKEYRVPLLPLGRGRRP